MKGSKVILNLGCGKDIIEGAVNIDHVKLPGVDLVMDLEKFPYPFKDKSVNEVHLYFVLEHLDEHFRVIEEIFRILKKGGMLYIRVPHGSSCYGQWGEFTHKRGYGYYSFDIFTKESDRKYYSKTAFKIVKKRIKYFLTYPYDFYKHNCWFPHWEKKWYSLFVKLFVNIVQFFIDLSPPIFERFWCYYVGGAAEVYVELMKI